MAYSNFNDDWNDILRSKIFPDAALKTLMMIPENTTIISFIDRYFVKAGYTTKLLTDENVRVVYSDMESTETDVPNIRKCQMSFDIYVKLEHLHNCDNDRLIMRNRKIAERLIQILTQERYLNGYRFWIVGDWDLGTRTAGYSRYNLTLGYMKVY